MGQAWNCLGSVLASVMFVSAIFRQFFPPELLSYLEKHYLQLVRFFYPYIEISFHEFSGSYDKRSEAFSAIQTYLRANATRSASRFKADFVKGSQSLVLSLEDYEEVTDEFNGVKVWWVLEKKTREPHTITYYPAPEKGFYKLTCHRMYRELITGPYINHVLKEGKARKHKDQQRKLYSNNPSKNWGWDAKWSHVYFEHPATFDTLAMTTKNKEEIMKDLKKFSESKEYYAKMGKAWKRGYLLYGPPGTGKSTLIAAMSNFLHYDVYDLELTTVGNNNDLRSLLIETNNKSIIVIEDVDCSLDITGHRVEESEDEDEDEDDEDEEKEKKEEVVKMIKGTEKKKSNVTLSGLLNFIDGLWSACGGERIIVFTTNHIDKLDPALIRRGRMDKHIEMSYCCFEAFKVLAKNYLDVASHELFEEISSLLAEINMTPADVAENLMPKSDDDDADTCLKNLIEALKLVKEEAGKKAEEQTQLKEEKEEKEREKNGKRMFKRMVSTFKRRSWKRIGEEPSREGQGKES